MQKTNLKRGTRLLILIASIAVLGLFYLGDGVGGSAGILPSVQAADGCNADTLNGAYAFLVEGYEFREQGPRIPNGGASFPVTILHTLDFDGGGDFDADGVITGGVGSANFGTNVERNFQVLSNGDYSVDSDCTGELTFMTDFGATIHLDFVIVDNGNELRFVFTNPTQVQSGTAKKMEVNCDVGESARKLLLDGTYGLLYRGNIGGIASSFSPAQPGNAGLFPAVFAHNLDFNGAGEITGGVGSMNFGTLLLGNFSIVSGNYTVNPDCTGNLSFTFDFGFSPPLDFVIVDADEFRLLFPIPFWVVAGDAKKQ